jgi:hypothetical protein
MAIKFVYAPREGEADTVGYIGPQINACGALLQSARLVEICLDAERIFDADVPFDVIEDSDLHTFVRSHNCFRRADGSSSPVYVSEEGDEWDDGTIFEDATGGGVAAGATARHERGMKR